MRKKFFLEMAISFQATTWAQAPSVDPTILSHLWELAPLLLSKQKKTMSLRKKVSVISFQSSVQCSPGKRHCDVGALWVSLHTVFEQKPQSCNKVKEISFSNELCSWLIYELVFLVLLQTKNFSALGTR